MSIEERGRVKELAARVEALGASVGKLMLEIAELRDKMKEGYSSGATVIPQPPNGAKPEPPTKGQRWR